MMNNYTSEIGSASHENLRLISNKIRNGHQLSQEEELSLAKLARSNDQWAKNMLAQSQIPLVEKIIVGLQRDREGVKMDHNDLYSIGLEALAKAIDAFDENRGCRLSTLVANYVRYEVSAASHDESFIRLPKSFYREMAQMKKAVGQLERRGNFNPSLDEIVNESGLSALVVRNVSCFSPCRIDLVQPTNDGDDGQYTIFDLIASVDLRIDEVIEEEETRHALYVAYNNLSHEKHAIIKSICLDGVNVKDLADQQGCSTQNIYKKFNSAIVELRENFSLSMRA